MFDHPFSTVAGNDWYPQRAEASIAEPTRIGMAWRQYRTAIKHRRIERIAGRIKDLAINFEDIDTGKLRGRLSELRPQLPLAAIDDAVTAEAVALVAAAARQTIDMTLTNAQLSKCLALLAGAVVEDLTGPGESPEVIGLAAVTFSLAGLPVHIISLNEFLAGRDMRGLTPLYRALGISVELVTSAMPDDHRRAAYRAGIVYCDYRQLTSDYLRDQEVLKQTFGIRQRFRQLRSEASASADLFLPGLICGLVSEADAVLIDAADDSVSNRQQRLSYDDRRLFRTALILGSRLHESIDYRWRDEATEVELTAAGKERIRETSLDLGGLWYRPYRREEIVHTAIIALFGCKREVHYDIENGYINFSTEFIDASNYNDQRLRDLKQLLSIKEGCELSPLDCESTLVCRKFFRRYHRISGMSPVASLVKRELAMRYGSPVVVAAADKQDNYPEVESAIFVTLQQKWSAIIEIVREIAQSQHPTLILCYTSDGAVQIANALHDANIETQLVTGQDHAKDAEKLAIAGRGGMVSILSNNAGNGIHLRTRQAGFHIILAELCEPVKRVKLITACNEQLIGMQQLVSLDEQFVSAAASQFELWTMRKISMRNGKISRYIIDKWLAWTATRIEKLQIRSRRDLQKFTDGLERQLSFSGDSG